MPLKFWDEAFSTATHLINMIPSKVINYETPMERLLHKNPTMHLFVSLVVPAGQTLGPITNAN
jgi:hypothetical protein